MTTWVEQPFLQAAIRGHEDVVRQLLLLEDIDPNAKDAEHGRTTLWLAAQGRRERIVRMLLEREDINANTSDTRYGQTPLWWAAGSGDEGIVRIIVNLRRFDSRILTSQERPHIWNSSLLA